MNKTYACLLLSAGVLAGCGTTPPGPVLPPKDKPVLPPAESVEKSQAFQPGDVLVLDVFQEPAVSGEFIVTSSGIIRHPVLGKVYVKGLSAGVAESLIERFLKDGLLVNPQVSVKHKSGSGRKIVINGEVAKPGIYDFSNDEKMTLMGAVARAGGFTSIARRSKVRIVRTLDGAEETIPVDVEDLFSGRKPDILLLPDDKIYVPESTF